MRRRYILAVLLLVITMQAFGQTKQVFQLNKLSARDTLLNGWKAEPGDNRLWAQPGFDDRNWRASDPGQDITEFEPIHQTGICWLRLRIQADSSLRFKQLTAWVFQYAASEIYLDGRLIKKYGTVSNIPSKNIALSPAADLFDITLEPGKIHLIAVRLGYQSGVPYASPFFTPLSAFCLYLNDYHAAQENIRQNYNTTFKALILSGAFSGMLFIVSLIYLFYFLFERQQKVNLYYSLSCALFFLLDLALTFFLDNIELVSTQMWVAYLMCIMFVCSSISMVLTIYTLFAYKKRPVFVIIIIIGVAALVYTLFSDITGFVVSTNVYLALCTVEGIRISGWGIKLQKKGAKIIFFGLISILVLNIWSAFLPQANFSSQVLGLLATLGFPLGMSMYFAIQNAITNQTLRSTLGEVQTLSAQKQEILADQNTLLETQVAQRTAELTQSLTNLKQAQTQLIQSEKMASLGELTAGIAHEIQNPLNFVNNFSEVNAELIDEMQEEIEKGDLVEVKAIANDIKENQLKISQHGKRADFIVKGMLQHSRTSTGERQPTNINLLADEFLKLSYHGLRAKDKSFNAELITNFDEALPKVNVVQQDIGRVLLNLFNNAFYAVKEKQKIAGAGYKPTVEVTTATKDKHIEITVKDNGTGIPADIKEKILQPFFTTKPSGEGTGLGLSLSYDIIVKGHHGSIDIESKENEYSVFIIKLER